MELEYLVFDRAGEGMIRTCVAAIVPKEVRRGRPFVLLVRIPYVAQSNGLPAAGELPKANRTEDAVTASLGRYDALHVGHISSDGAMLAAYYAPDRVPETLRGRTGLLRSVEVAVESRPDGSWSWYERELAPTPEEEELNRNRSLHLALRAQGDDEARLRPVDFTFFFRDPDGRDRFLRTVGEDGFVPNDEGLWTTDPPHVEYGVTVVGGTSVQQERMAFLCARLRIQAAANGGAFDGWGCLIAN